MAYKDSPAYKEKTRRSVAKWRANHREEHRASVKAWRLDNPVKLRKLRVDHRAKRRGAIKKGTIDIQKLLDEWDGLCGICKLPVEGKYEVDHIVPIAIGGIHSQENLQLVHPSCNHSKKK